MLEPQEEGPDREPSFLYICYLPEQRFLLPRDFLLHVEKQGKRREEQHFKGENISQSSHRFQFDIITIIGLDLWDKFYTVFQQ